MKRIKTIIICIFLSIFIFGCASSQSFVRIRGTKNADLHGIRVYQKAPPENYPYKSLGFIYAEGQGAFTLMRLDNALENLTLKARELDANAIINWRIKPRFGWVLHMEGEAVIFDTFPLVPND